MTFDKLKMHSPDLTQENIAKIQALFPTCVTEALDSDTGELRRMVDFDLLRQELSDHIVEGPKERYELSWPGKRESVLAAHAPIAKTLRPCREESVDFDTTQNLFIEGDNLDALKLLQETYLGKVKMIYIDPPYNTGNDFIYKDDFKQSSEEYLRGAAQVDEEGNWLVANPDSSGRYHSDWLSMMASRLKLARNLLRDDGLIFISIDDHEMVNLSKLCNEVFGEKNVLNSFVWISNLKGRQIALCGPVTTKEHVLCCSKDHRNIHQFRHDIFTLTSLIPSAYIGFDYEVQTDKLGDYVTKNELYNSNSIFNEETRPNLVYDIYFNPTTQDVRTDILSNDHLHKGYVKISPKTNNNGTHKYHAFRWGRDKVESESYNLKFVESADGWKVFTKVRDVSSTSLKDLIMNISTNDGARDLKALNFSSKLLEYPKPISLLQLLLAIDTEEDDIILDFFAGSSTTAHAVMKLNAEDGGNRRFIMVQLPEVVAEDSEAAKAGYSNIADISKERIRRAGKQILEGDTHEGWNKDVGFRVLKVDSSNMKDVYYRPNELSQQDLKNLADNVKGDRSEEDLLFQVLLDWGVDLTLPIRRETVQDRTVFTVDDNALVACFAPQVSEEIVKELAARAPLRMVLRDAGFESDAIKINVQQILRQLSPTTELKVI